MSKRFEVCVFSDAHVGSITALFKNYAFREFRRKGDINFYQRIHDPRKTFPRLALISGDNTSISEYLPHNSFWLDDIREAEQAMHSTVESLLFTEYKGNNAPLGNSVSMLPFILSDLREMNVAHSVRFCTYGKDVTLKTYAIARNTHLLYTSFDDHITVGEKIPPKLKLHIPTLDGSEEDKDLLGGIGPEEHN